MTAGAYLRPCVPGAARVLHLEEARPLEHGEVRELALGHTAHRFSKPRFEPRQPGFQTSALDAYILLPW